MAPAHGAAVRFDDASTRPTMAELRGSSVFAEFAKNHWHDRSTPVSRIQTEELKREVWDTLEREDFPVRSLVLLENLQILEKYLWPGYSKDSPNVLVLLIVLVVNVKRKDGFSAWGTLSTKPSEFSSLFHRILSLNLDSSLSAFLQTQLLTFVTQAFQSLDNVHVRRECIPLVSISIWNCLHNDELRAFHLDQDKQARKAWKLASKRYATADEPMKVKIQFDRSWICSVFWGFLDRLYSSTDYNNVMYCERFLELLIDLESQIPTRRYVHLLLRDVNVLSAVRLSPMFNETSNGLLRDLYNLLQHYYHFPAGSNGQFSQSEAYRSHCREVTFLQRTVLKHFKEKLTVLALSNNSSVTDREELQGHLSRLTGEELIQLCHLLHFRTLYPKTSSIKLNREFYVNVLVSHYEHRQSFQESIADLSIWPTEDRLYDASLLRNESYDGTRPLAIPKLNLQYLSVGDFLWRSFILYRCEAFYEVRKHLEETITRLKPQPDGVSGATAFRAFSRMALPIPKVTIFEEMPASVGSEFPSAVRADVEINTQRLDDNVRQEWASLRPGDVIFLISVVPPESGAMHVNGASPSLSGISPMRHIRSAEVSELLDDSGRRLKETPDGASTQASRFRRLRVNLDAQMFKSDKERSAAEHYDIYDEINLIVRRRSRENNFKPVLESIRSLTLSDVPICSWLQEVFLGFGDPTAASYTNLEHRLRSLDFRDTFLDWQHLVQSFPGKIIEPSEEVSSSFGPPYVLESMNTRSEHLKTNPAKKRRRGDNEEQEIPQKSPSTVLASTYSPPNMGPYPSDVPRANHVRFTPAQVEAIQSGSQPGLTLIVGPPGTGKTDVATQIINNIYHNFPSQRTLLIAHSNQALNQLFMKITALDIDERHLLRLGHGETDLGNGSSYGKQGRVESFMEKRNGLLSEVNKIAANFSAPGAHGNSCETAGYFNSVYVLPAWTKFQEAAENPNASTDVIVNAFPFNNYFADAPQPLFALDLSRDELLKIANGCYRHIEKIFLSLEDIRPFELLRNSKDKENYLLIKEARIVAMTTTHAAIRRQEIANLGFHYDNVVMEESAQVTEIETFIPLASQKPVHGQLPLQRVVMCGDHLQNSPIVQNIAFRQYANLEQSMFLRFIRLGVPAINLDMQGRARSSIASLYSWRYPGLIDLPLVKSEEEYMRANAGFKYDFQFIQVLDYKGSGEKEPAPHFIQNLGEAEYAVAIYQYMRLLGYPASKISILTTYAGQRALIKDVLNHRCARNRLFGLPKTVTTVDKYQGEQNEYVIVSLTRTNRIGYLRDIRRLTVALSRARLGLYILGRREVFESCYELREACERLFSRPDKLQLVPGEMYPTPRTADAEVDATEMEGVEHLGQYVYEMSQAKIAALKSGSQVVGTRELRPQEAESSDEGEGAPAQGLPDEEEEEHEAEEVE